MLTAGAIVSCVFRGAHLAKHRPALVVSTDAYHANRPDVILAIITSNLADASAPTDYVLHDWMMAGLHRASAFRAFIETHPVNSIHRVIGRLSDRDWKEVQARLRLAIAVL
jgi:mRNA interferase MazF